MYVKMPKCQNPRVRRGEHVRRGAEEKDDKEGKEGKEDIQKSRSKACKGKGQDPREIKTRYFFFFLFFSTGPSPGEEGRQG